MRRRQNEAEELYRQQSQKALISKFEQDTQQTHNGSTPDPKTQQQSMWRRPAANEEDREEALPAPALNGKFNEDRQASTSNTQVAAHSQSANGHRIGEGVEENENLQVSS